jgi:hypothetical protein
MKYDWFHRIRNDPMVHTDQEYKYDHDENLFRDNNDPVDNNNGNHL